MSLYLYLQQLNPETRETFEFLLWQSLLITNTVTFCKQKHWEFDGPVKIKLTCACAAMKNSHTVTFSMKH